MARVNLTVSPGARRTELVGPHGEAWRVRIAAAPDRGRANDAVLDLVADAVGVRRADVALVAGHASRRKIVDVAGIDDVELRARLASRAASRS